MELYDSKQNLAQRNLHILRYKQNRGSGQRVPVAAVVNGAEGVASAGHAARGAVGEVPLLTVLTLQPGVAWQAGALARPLIAVFRIQHTLTAAVTPQLCRDTHKHTHGQVICTQRINTHTQSGYMHTETDITHRYSQVHRYYVMYHGGELIHQLICMRVVIHHTYTHTGLQIKVAKWGSFRGWVTEEYWQGPQ